MMSPTSLSDPTEALWSYYEKLYTTRPMTAKTSLPHCNLSQKASQTLGAVVTASKVHKAICRTQKWSSLGEDGLPYKFYQHHIDIITPSLARLFSEVLAGTPLPQSWYRALVQLFLKDGKDPTLEESYCPISLLNTDIKLMTSIITARLQLVIKQLLPQTQTEFV